MVVVRVPFLVWVFSVGLFWLMLLHQRLKFLLCLGFGAFS